MAVVAVLLATVTAASIDGDPHSHERDHPHATFSFAVENSTVVIEHVRGDTLDGAAVYVESAERGRLGNVDGSDGLACTSVATEVEPGTTCRVPDAADERLVVVWAGPDNRTLTLADRDAPVATTSLGSPVVTTQSGDSSGTTASTATRASTERGTGPVSTATTDSPSTGAETTGSTRTPTNGSDGTSSPMPPGTRTGTSTATETRRPTSTETRTGQGTDSGTEQTDSTDS